MLHYINTCYFDIEINLQHYISVSVNLYIQMYIQYYIIYVPIKTDKHQTLLFYSIQYVIIKIIIVSNVQR